MTDVWPFAPLLGCCEYLGWRTEILDGYTKEQRIALRPYPRQTYEYTSRILAGQDHARAKVLARQNGSDLMYVPCWGEKQDVGAVASAATAIAVDTSWGDWVAGDSVLIRQTDSLYAVKEIATVNPTSIDLVGTVGTTFTAAQAVPLRLAYSPDGFNFARQSTIVDVSATFEVDDEKDRSGEYVSSYPTYLGLDVVTDRPWLVDEVSERLGRAADWVDSEFGPLAPQNQRTYADNDQQLIFVETREDAWHRRKWLSSLRGQQKKFWMPSFNNDLVLQEDIESAETQLLVKSIGTAGFYVDEHVMIELWDGTRYFRKISAAASSTGGNDNVTLSSALGANIAQSAVRGIYLMACSRIAADRIKIDHRFPHHSVTNVPTKELSPLEIPT